MTKRCKYPCIKSVLSLAVCLGVVGPAFGEADARGGPAITRSQIEADWLKQAELRFPPRSEETSADADAAGGCDGVIDGKWGFHTANEKNPWWQVDLQQAVSIDRVVLYNRCEKGMAERASQIMILVGDAPERLAVAYQHGGQVFYGHSGGEPLSVRFGGKPARYVRLQLPTTSYFHLDEVQIFASGSEENVARGKPATQSSTSQWSKPAAKLEMDWPAIVKTTIERGDRLAESLVRSGVNVASLSGALRRAAASAEKLPAAAEEAWRACYFDARWAIRDALVSHPLLDFDSILFVKRARRSSHLSDQCYGWWTRPGGGVHVLDGFKSPRPLAPLPDEPVCPGQFRAPDLDFDGGRLVVATPSTTRTSPRSRTRSSRRTCPGRLLPPLRDQPRRQPDAALTAGRLRRFRWPLPLRRADSLPFDSQGTFLQCSAENTAKTLTADLPDSYVRCGGGNSAPYRCSPST